MVRRAVGLLLGCAAALVCTLLGAAPAGADGGPGKGLAGECRAAGLAGARVSTSLELTHRDRSYTKVDTKLDVDLPARWAFAQDLLLSERSPEYVRAMTCLTRGERGQQRWGEWRTVPPKVTTGKGRVRVVVRAHSWVNAYRDPVEVGVWQVLAGAEKWRIRLRVPPALAGARWIRIAADTGEPGADSASPRPQAAEGTTGLVWLPEAQRKAHAKAAGKKADAKAAGKKTAGKQAGVKEAGAKEAGSKKAPARAVPSVRLSIRPPWQRSWAAQSDRLTAAGLSHAGVLGWTVTVSVLLLAAARRCLRRPGPPSAPQYRTLRNLAAWAPAAVGVDLLSAANDMLNRYEDRTGDRTVWLDELIRRNTPFALAIAAVLFVFARPPRRVAWAAGALALPPLLVALWPGWFGLCPMRGGYYVVSDTALTAQTVAACCVLALTLLGLAAAGWRMAADAGMIPPSRRPAGGDRALRLRVALPLTAGLTLAVALSFTLTEERNWRRATWLVDPRSAAYGSDHRANFLWEAVRSLANGPSQLIGYDWMLTALAVLAALRVWHNADSLSPLDEPADRLLFLLFFPVGVAIGTAYFVDNGLLSFVEVPMYLLSLYAAVTLLRRHTVLAQPLEKSGRPLAREVGPAARASLLDTARTYREIHSELRRLEQGTAGDTPPKRRDLENDLRDLHDWNPGGSTAGSGVVGGERLPDKVSVVEAALAFGPRDDWWDNGVRGARLALVPGLPAAVLSAWAWDIRGESWQGTLSSQFGLLYLLLDVGYWLLTWAGAGFTLGAAWRCLPGRRGAVKALPVTAAFALPVAAGAVVTRFVTLEGAANVALFLVAMLFVLTVTAIALDLDTFRGERRYWQSRLGLLLSVYQMRYFSLQFAYLIAQVVAMISVWQFFAQPDTVPDPGSGVATGSGSTGG